MYLSCVSKLVLGVFGWFLFLGGCVCLVLVFLWSEPRLLNKEPHCPSGQPLPAAAGSGAGPHAQKYFWGQLEPPRLLRTEPGTPVSGGACEDAGYGSWSCHLVPTGALCEPVPGSRSCWSLGPLRQDLVRVLQPGITWDAGGDGVRGVPGCLSLPRTWCWGVVQHPRGPWHQPLPGTELGGLWLPSSARKELD